jgi:DNA-binding PadR family transcriptional regulator
MPVANVPGFVWTGRRAHMWGEEASAAGRERAPRRGGGSLRTALLAAVVEQPSHGYDLAHRLSRRMGPAMQIDVRRVYEALEQLEKEGLASSVEEATPAAPHRRRRVFCATERGRAEHLALLEQRQPVPLVRADIYAQIAFSMPEQADRLLAKLDEYELDCIEMHEQTVEPEVHNGSWHSRMIAMSRVALTEHLQAEIRWITRTRREIEEFVGRSR